jgi:hypothetical protein
MSQLANGNRAALDASRSRADCVRRREVSRPHRLSIAKRAPDRENDELHKACIVMIVIRGSRQSNVTDETLSWASDDAAESLHTSRSHREWRCDDIPRRDAATSVILDELSRS